MTLLSIFGLAALAATILTGISIPVLRGLDAIAHANDRTMHVGAIPKGGGLPLLVAAGGTMAAAGGVMSSPVATSLILATALLAGLSFLNDIHHLPAPVRLTAHACAAALLVASLPPEARVLELLPVWLERAALAGALVAFMNFFNFMDGINAISGTETIAIALGYILIASATPLLANATAPAAALAGATAGFLFWNARPTARVFLGDAGSIPLGFLTGALLIDLAVSGQWAAALILPSVFVYDAGATLAKRIARGERWWQPHRSHAYQRAARTSSHLAISARVAIASMLLIGAAYQTIESPALGLLAAAAIVATLMFSLEATARLRSSDSDP